MEHKWVEHVSGGNKGIMYIKPKQILTIKPKHLPQSFLSFLLLVVIVNSLNIPRKVI